MVVITFDLISMNLLLIYEFMIICYITNSNSRGLDSLILVKLVIPAFTSMFDMLEPIPDICLITWVEFDHILAYDIT